MSEKAIKQLEKLMEIAEKTFDSDRFKKVEKLHEYFAERMILAPASSKVYYHCCYSGGYLDHVHNVINGSLRVAQVLKQMKGKIDFTLEELTFSAMHHDLGKIGDLDYPYYIPQDSEWHRERGELYKRNPDIPFMTVQDRSLYLLQHFDIELTQNEWVAIRCHDGPMEEGNKPYFTSYSSPPAMPPSNLNYILHMGDWLAMIAERDIRRSQTGEKI